jgi:hypothetical protein
VARQIKTNRINPVLIVIAQQDTADQLTQPLRITLRLYRGLDLQQATIHNQVRISAAVITAVSEAGIEHDELGEERRTALEEPRSQTSEILHPLVAREGEYLREELTLKRA